MMSLDVTTSSFSLDENNELFEISLPNRVSESILIWWLLTSSLKLKTTFAFELDSLCFKSENKSEKNISSFNFVTITYCEHLDFEGTVWKSKI